MTEKDSILLFHIPSSRLNNFPVTAQKLDSVLFCIASAFQNQQLVSIVVPFTCLKHWASFTSAHSCHDKSFLLQASHLLICILLHFLLLSVQTTPAHGSGFKWRCWRDPSEQGLFLNSGPNLKGSWHIPEEGSPSVTRAAVTDPAWAPCTPFSGASLVGECYPVTCDYS